jgi:hypothetical protein
LSARMKSKSGSTHTEPSFEEAPGELAALPCESASLCC